VDLRLLGPVEVWAPDGPIDLGPPRQRSVLAALACDSGRVVRAEVLIDRVWGDRPPDQARATLHSYLARLRKILEAAGGARLVRRSGGYLLDGHPELVDLYRFRSLVDRAERDRGARAELLSRALELWHGVPLAGLPSPWAAEMRAALHTQYQQAALAWAETELERGNAGRTVGRLTDLLAADPYAEPVAAMLMRVRYSLGRTADALSLYTTVKDRLADELGADPARELREAHQLILRGETTTPAPVRGPALLPPDAYGFVGRERELSRLDEALQRTARQPTAGALSVVTGPPGVGKTSLAVHWAHRVRDRFPDGQLYLDLRGVGPARSAVTPGQAVRRFLDALGVTSRRIPSDVDAQLDLYRSEMAGRRILVVLDNARDVAQVRPLLPGGAGTAAVVTSRNLLTSLVATGGARAVHLDVFSDDEGRRFLRRRIDDGRAEAEPQAVDRITALCGRLPLALAMVAARATQRPAFSLAALTDDLTRPGGRLDLPGGYDDEGSDLRSVFARSYEALAPGAARLFMLLGAWGEPEVTLATAASLAGAPMAESRRTLAWLVDGHLLTERAAGRYVLHDLLLEYAGELAPAFDDVAPAVRRGFDHLLHTAHAADLALVAHGDLEPLGPPGPGTVVEPIGTMEEAFDWFGRELTQLVGAVTRAGRTPGFESYVPRLADTMTTFLYRRGYWPEQVAVQEAAVLAAGKLGDRVGAARAHHAIGNALTTPGRHDEADEHLQRAVELFAEAGDVDGEARAHRHLAWLNETRHRYADALHHSRRALALAAAAGLEHAEAEALNSVGWFCTLLDRHDEAAEYCRRSLAMHRRRGNRAGEANALDSIGYVCHRQGRYDEATRHYERAVELFREVGSRTDEAEALDHLGDAYAALGDADRARAAWTEALSILEPQGYAAAEVVRAKMQ
jgi:DNA-binding SARP family transcriptional activator/tetratricopeptide (TPR) repeat protein